MAAGRLSWPQAAAAALRRELGLLAGSRWDQFLLLGLPLLAVVTLAVMFLPGSFNQVPIAVVDADHSALSRAAVRHLQATPKLQVAASPVDLPEAMGLMRADRVYAVVYLPPGLQERHARREDERAIIYFNAAFQTVATQAADAAQAALGQALRPGLVGELAELARIQPPRIQVNIVGNPQASFELFLQSLATPLVLAMLLGCAAVYAVGREWADASLADWLAHSDGRLLAALLGKLAPYVLVFWLWSVVFTLYLAGARGWQVAGSLPLLLLAQLLFYAGIGAISALLVALLRDLDTALSVSAFYLGSGLSFAGATLTLNGGSWFVRAWSAVLPSTSYVQIQEQQWVMGSPLASSAVPLAVLLAFIVLPLALALPLLARMAQPGARQARLHAPPTPAGWLAAMAHTLRTVALNRPIVLTAVAAVVLYGFYYPSAYTMQTVIKVPVAVVDLDRSPLSRSLLRKLDATREVRLAAQPDSIAEGQALLQADKVDGLIVLTGDLQASVLKGAPGGVSVYLKGAYLVRARFIGEALRGAIGAALQESIHPLAALLSPGHLGVQQRALFNPDNGYGSYVVPGVASIILQATLLFAVAMFMGLKRESGNWRMGHRGFLGTWCAFTLLGSLMGWFFFGFIFWWQDYPRGGNLAGLLLAVPLFAASVSALGLLVGSLFERHERSMQILAGTSIPVFFLSGLSWPFLAMPALMVALAKLIPSTTAVLMFVQLNAMGATLAEIAPRLATLAALTLLYGAAAWLRLTRPTQATAPAKRLCTPAPQSAQAADKLGNHSHSQPLARPPLQGTTMSILNETHDPALRSWLASAHAGGTDFPIQNLPFAVFRRRGSTEPARGGVAIGDQIIDLAELHQAKPFSGRAAEALAAGSQSTLNALMALTPAHWSALRLALSRALREGAPEQAVLQICLVPQAQVEYLLPARIGDYTDFYTSIHHATNVGRLFRPDNPLMPNYKWVPIGYHGRASSVVVSGQNFARPCGQLKAPESSAPVLGASQRLDIELELGVFLGQANALGEAVPITEAEDHVFGLCLLNDWSARDIQAWEYQPLGPFLAKNFATSISPWVVSMEALAPFRTAPERPAGDPAPLPYLDSEHNRSAGALDVQMQVTLQTPAMRAQDPASGAVICTTSYRHAYWTLAQMVAHHSVNGCNLQPGDLLGTGTLSGPTLEQAGALLELTAGGKNPIKLPNGEQRAFLEDGDTVVFRAWCDKPGQARIGFGECRGQVLPARSL
ncbi:fumarylacetoacetase [Comamonas sp. NLF-1-9]|nr:fumarylacetoacetase [Comamonas sp. NLF-1-9]